MYSKAKKHFKKVDKVLHGASQEFEIEDLKPSKDLFQDIVSTIIGQQLSGKAADTIFQKFRKLFPRRKITAKKILALSAEKMRKCGLSGAKARAVVSLAEHVVLGKLKLKKLSKISDEEVLEELTQVKGIGPWTAQMILMFSLARADIFSKGDLGLRKGIMQLYGMKNPPNERKMDVITAPWSPYRTYAARVLWRVADKKKLRIARKRKK